MRNARKIITTLVLSVYIVVYAASFVLAEDPTATPAPDSSSRKADIERQIAETQKKLTETRAQKNTLSQQVNYIDNQVSLTSLRMQETTDKVAETERDIELFSTKIDGLDGSLEDLTNQLLHRVQTSYKQKEKSMFDFLLDSTNVNVFFSQLKYLKNTQDTNEKMVVQLQQTKQNFEEQKDLREKKKEELETYKTKLTSQKVELQNQQGAKKTLLAVTQNDEKLYQKQLEEYQRLLAGFRSFVQAAGGGSIGANGLGSGSDGAYMSQRDSRWSGMHMGNSNDTVLEVGCLITSISMVLKKNGNDYSPATIAANPSYFFGNTAYMVFPGSFSWPGGLRYTNVPKSTIGDKLDEGKYVIVGVYAGAYGTHYVVITGKDGDDYIMHDPYYGPDLKFSSHYSKGSIFVAAVFN